MDERYVNWIAAYVERNLVRVNVGTPNEALVMFGGSCGSATTEMVQAFPELRREAGFVQCLDGSQSEHWWCLTPDGEVVDPTAKQFDRNGGVMSYRSVCDSDLLRVGRCMNCGEGIYESFAAMRGGAARSRTFCDEDCERAAIAHFGL